MQRALVIANDLFMDSCNTDSIINAILLGPINTIRRFQISAACTVRSVKAFGSKRVNAFVSGPHQSKPTYLDLQMGSHIPEL